jgi:transcriptional regulator with XRE-family HTH domain
MRVYRRQRREVESATHPFVKTIFREMVRQRATLADVADRSGVCVKVLGNWKSGNRLPKLRDIEAVFAVLGFEIKALPKKEECE